ncbi:MAG TPA: adenine deaminase [Candidatus Bathyarchaeota archaeon]|nr:adenine deaminase [Candidatus Bathyarchaeota archaeon]
MKGLPQVFRLLIDTAMGRVKADLVLRGGNLIDVYTAEIVEGVDVAIKSGRIALVGSAEHTIGPSTEVIDVEGRYISPGFLDGHIHIESSLLTLRKFAEVVLPHGTTSVFIDPHEIANVLGLRGVKLMHDEGKELPLKVFVMVPSCVPATSSEFETSGAEITAEDVEEAIKWENVIGLGEVMNYPGVLLGDEELYRKIEITLSSGKVVEGHFFGNINEELNAYLDSGASSNHEATNWNLSLWQARLGMYTMMREGSAWKDLKNVVRAVTGGQVDSRNFCLVSDDKDVIDLLEVGHMDHLIRRAIEEGVDPIRAIQMSTINTATHFGVEEELGGVAPNRVADIVLLRDLEKVDVEKVIVDGRVIAENGRMLSEISEYRYPRYVYNTVKLRRMMAPTDFRIPVEKGVREVTVRVIGVKEGSLVTEHLLIELKVEGGEIRSNVGKDVIKVAVIERHGRRGTYSVGLVKGFGLMEGAAATSVSHDSHNIVAIGVSDKDMATAVNHLINSGGGMAVARRGEIVRKVDLPIAGLMSSKDPEELAEDVRRSIEVFRELGCMMKQPFMAMSLLTLPVIPELKITDKGLIDTTELKKVDVIAET